jgi:hypothetical protein
MRQSRLLIAPCTADQTALPLRDDACSLYYAAFGRSAPKSDAKLAFTRTEIELLERLVRDTPQNAQAPPMARNVIRLAQLGGHLARASDPPPGNTVMWRGIQRLTDIQLGYELALKRSG